MGRSPCCEKAHTNKGAWTKEEDERLINYIRVHGEGCWRSLPTAAGLHRCGKSCRLRWINYLRPDLKRGNFTQEEDDIIIKLHSLLGNKWSIIAGKLAGRTDNEIKNYWNTHLKRKLISRGIDPQTHRSFRATVTSAVSPAIATTTNTHATTTPKDVFPSICLDFRNNNNIIINNNGRNSTISNDEDNKFVIKREWSIEDTSGTTEETRTTPPLQNREIVKPEQEEEEEEVNLDLSIGLPIRNRSSSSSCVAATAQSELFYGFWGVAPLSLQAVPIASTAKVKNDLCMCWQLSLRNDLQCSNCRMKNVAQF